MSSNEDKLRQDAIDWVKIHKGDLFDQAIEESGFDTAFYDPTPAASFMAGTPGAGKTELSKRFIEQFAIRPIRLDADDFRNKIPGYTGSNSEVVQPAAALAVDKVLERVFKKRYSFILDATFAIGKAVQNLKRANRRGYSIQIFFVYQDPIQAWEFTKLREQKEGRYVPKETFINAYFASRNNVHRAKEQFGNQVSLHMIVKDYVHNIETVYYDIETVEQFLEKVYTKEELERILK